MGQRRKARILALQALYQVDLTRTEAQKALSFIEQATEKRVEVRAFAQALVKGVVAHIEDLDRLIQESSTNWRIERMSPVDRNILRLAVFELVFHPEIPSKVAINEAVELGKLFSSEDASAFINGVLDQILISSRASKAGGSP